MAQPTKRSVLDSLTKAQLVVIAQAFEVHIARSQPKDAFVDGIASSHRASFEKVLESLGQAELAKVCREHGLDDGGREARVLVDRLMGRESSAAEEAGPGYEPVLTPVPQRAAKPAGKKRVGGKKAKPTPLHQDAGEGDHARWASSTKMRLSRFALDAAAGYRGADGDIACVRDLIRCFGWGPDEELPAEIPAMRMIVAQGTRTERRIAAVLRERRAVVEVIDRERSIQDGWTALLPVILQLEPVPQYVVVTNQRDVALYDLRKSRTEPRLSRAVDELPKYSEAFPFLARDWSPGATPQIINVDKVSKEVAELVARVYRSFKAEHPNRGDDVIRFTLQCILAMFAEDIGLLPQSHFTSLLYQAAERGDAEQRLAELFRLMSTPEHREGGNRAIRYFNGGLFSTPVTLPVNRDQLTALTKAAEANWTHVDPHIFGSVFQGIMDDAERHASGAHYTAKEDIMRVVGPTIVEPWRKRIGAAKTLTELRSLRADLVKLRVLDPACGSGNFLYIAFREMYRLENEIIARMHEFVSVSSDPALRAAWGSGILTTNFYGIDINRFAVELARATLNIAKKIAFEERREFVAQRFDQIEIELDPSLPLDNLEKNITCCDALFSEWPVADVIIGNPPFLGLKRLRAELGADYVDQLQDKYPKVGGDLCIYWFRRAHDTLNIGGRAGLVATSAIRSDTNRTSSLDYITSNNGIITNAVSQQEWPGEAVVSVSMICWHKGWIDGPHTLIVDGQPHTVASISPHLQLHADMRGVSALRANDVGTSQGVTYGTKEFYLSRSEAVQLTADKQSRKWVRAISNGDDLLRGKLAVDPDYAIHLGECATEEEAHVSGRAFEHLRDRVLPVVRAKAARATTSHYDAWLRNWWRPFWHRQDFLRLTIGRERVLACSRVASRPIYVFVSPSVILLDKIQIFNLEDDYSFGVLQSSTHWRWVEVMGGRQHERRVYTMDVWETFPWPQQPSARDVELVAENARALRSARRELMERNNWSLRALYQAAEVPGPHPLKDAQARLDAAVAAAYDLPAGQEPLEFLLELNLALAEDEAAGRPIQGPGLPAGLDPNDPRWMSTDCIEPPPLDGETSNHDG